MASNIEFTTIDGEYPVAGVDNDTQGFRDNFSIIKSSLGTAQTEITDLQENTAKLDQDNNFNGTEVADVQITASTEKFYAAGTLVNSQYVSFLNGHYQTVFTTDDSSSLTLTLSDWPEGDNRLAKMTIELSCPESEAPATQIEWLTEGAGTFRFESGFPDPFILDSTPRIVEFWTYNNGTIVYGRYLGEYPNV